MKPSAKLSPFPFINLFFSVMLSVFLFQNSDSLEQTFVSFLDNLDEAYTMAGDWMMPVSQRNCGCAMGCDGFWQFLGFKLQDESSETRCRESPSA